MPISEAKKRNNANYTAKCDYINIRPLKPEGAKIRAAAENAGQSLQGYILQAIRERMERDGLPIDQPMAGTTSRLMRSMILRRSDKDSIAGYS